MSGALQAIVWGGATCGILDGLATTTHFGLKGIKPVSLWQGVASGLFGEPAFRQGWTSGSLGLLLHFVIAFTAAPAFVVGCGQIPFLARAYWISGPLYGVLAFLVMNLIVLPISARPKRPASTTDRIIQLMIHVLFVGLPIAIAANRFLFLD